MEGNITTDVGENKDVGGGVKVVVGGIKTEVGGNIEGNGRKFRWKRNGNRREF